MLYVSKHFKPLVFIIYHYFLYRVFWEFLPVLVRAEDKTEVFHFWKDMSKLCVYLYVHTYTNDKYCCIEIW